MADAKGETVTCKFDARGRKYRLTDRIEAATEFRFDQNSNLTSITDGEDSRTQYLWSLRNQKSQCQYPDHVAGSDPGDQDYGITQHAFDGARRPTLITDQQGDTCQHDYDLTNRLLARNYRTRVNSPAGTIADSDTFTYDDASRRLTATSGRYNNIVTCSYDEAARKSSESLTLGGQTYTCTTDYDDASRVATLTYPDGTTVDRTYTARSQLQEIKRNGTTIDTRTYDDGGRMATSAYNNGVSETRSYNIDNTLASIGFTGAPIGDLTYGWDENKNKTSESITGTMSGFGFDVGTSGYDDEDRLTNWQRDDSGLDQAWNLSLVGNWNSFTENASVQNRTHGPAHELLTAAGQAVQHDAKGNQTLIPAVLRTGNQANPLNLRWDFDNKMLGADTDNDGIDDVSYQFDAMGRRSPAPQTVPQTAPRWSTSNLASKRSPITPSVRYLRRRHTRITTPATSTNPS